MPQHELKNAYIGIPAPTSIVLDKSAISLTTVGQTAQLTATIEPTVCDKSITWSSDDTTIASVDTSGLVTCVTPGECTITATTVNGLTASCSVDDQQGWQPGANTIAYYPLTSSTTVNDKSGNNRNLTNSNVSFGTQFGVNCAYISGNADSSHSVTKYLYGNITGLPTGSGARTYSFWIYNNNASVPSVADDMYIFQGQASTNKMVFAHGGGVDGSGLTISQRGSSGNFGASIRQQRCHNAVVYDGSKFEWYVNGTSRGTWTKTINTGSNKFSIFGASENGYWNAFNGGMSELILEDKARTAQEVANYYNQTKSNYGL